MSDDLVKAARSSYAPPHYVDGKSVRPLLHVLADRIEAQTAEITRLRAELATGRREGMEELGRHFREAAAGTPIGHEDHQRGASTYNWLIYCATTISAIKDRAAAKEGKP